MNDAKSTAAQFLADHEQLQIDLEGAKLTLDDQRKEIERLDAKLAIQSDLLAQANTDKNTYLQYSFELAAQLQFIVAGSSRALLIAAQVRNRITMQASNIPPVPGSDIAELEDILDRIGEHNAAANDGRGMTNKVIKEAPANDGDDFGKPKPQTFAMEGNGIGIIGEGKPIAAPEATLPIAAAGGIAPAAPDTVTGVFVDRNGHPIEASTAIKGLQAL